MSGPFSVEAHGNDNGWYLPEATHRWAKHSAIFPVPPEASGFEAEVINHLPIKRAVTLSSGGNSESRVLKSGERARLAVAVAGSRVEIKTDGKAHGLADPRELGIAVVAVKVTTGPR